MPNISTGINLDSNFLNLKEIEIKEVRPESFGQALRISGVNPSDVSILSVYMKRYFNE